MTTAMKTRLPTGRTQPPTWPLFGQRIVVFRRVLALAVGIVFLAPLAVTSPARAAVPPPCKKVKVSLATVQAKLKKWSGWRGMKGIELIEPRLASCLSTGGSARLFAMAGRRTGKPRMIWQTELIISVNGKSGRPYNNKATKKQVDRAVRYLKQLPDRALKSPVVSAWLIRYGSPERAMIDDEGGLSDPCVEFMRDTKSGHAQVMWCGGKTKAVKRLTLPRFNDLPIPGTNGLAAQLQTGQPGCGLGRTHLTSIKLGNPPEPTWRATVAFTGPRKRCGGSMTLIRDIKGDWHPPGNAQPATPRRL